MFNAVEIEINHGCNMACAYCPNSIGSRIEKGHMSPELYASIIAQLKQINFSGRLSYDFYNEPTLSPNLMSFIALARTELPGVSIELYSNGTLITSELYRDLLKAGVTKFIITKHSDAESDFEFDKTFSILTEEEKKHLLYRPYTKLSLTNRGGVLDGVGGEMKTAFMPCHLPEQMLTITVKGNVVPCFEDFYQKNQMGNVLETPLLDIWNSAKYVEFRAMLKKGLRHKFDACKDCNRLEVL